MFWVRYTVSTLLAVFVGTSIAANVLPLYRYQCGSSSGTFDTSVNMYIKTSTFYLWYHEVQLATDAGTNMVEFPETGGAITLPGKTKMFLRVLAANMKDLPNADGTDAPFSHVGATCASFGRELLAAAAMAVLGAVFGGVTLGVVVWGRGPSNSCLVPGWIAFTLTFCAALFTLVALALVVHMRNNPVCYHYAYSNQGYSFDSGFILLCLSVGGYVITAVLQAMCPMCCCCDGARGYDDTTDNSDNDKYPSGDSGGMEMESMVADGGAASGNSCMFREGDGKHVKHGS